MFAGRLAVGLLLTAMHAAFDTPATCVTSSSLLHRQHRISRTVAEAATISVTSFSRANRSGASKVLSEKDRASIKELVIEQCKQLSRIGVRYWLDRGTLLGAARDGGVIDFDDDGDLAILHLDSEKVSDVLEMWRQGIALPEGMTAEKMFWNGSAYLRFNLRGMHSDVAQAVASDADTLTDPYGEAHTSTFNSELGTMTRNVYTLRRDQVLPTKPCTFEGFEGCQCPNDVASYVAAQYGPEWYVPLPLDGSIDAMKAAAPMIKKVLEYDSKHLTPEMKTDLQEKYEKLIKNDTGGEGDNGGKGKS